MPDCIIPDGDVTEYNVRLRHADDIPVVNLGNKTKDVFVPAELCEIEPGQAYAAALTDRETAQMIKCACNPPHQNAQSITEQGLALLGLKEQASPMKGFGVSVSVDMAVVSARILKPPRIMYGSDKRSVSNGSWNILDVHFAVPASLSRCAILVLNDEGPDDFEGNTDPELTDIINGLLQKFRDSGMQVEDGTPPIVFIQLPRPKLPGDPCRQNAIDLIDQELKALPEIPNILLVFMSNRDPHIYPGLKGLCDTKLGVSTVCMLLKKVRIPLDGLNDPRVLARNRRNQDQYFSNIALKVNTKLGGVNHRIEEDRLSWLKDTMLVGMDVTHPGVGFVKGTPSIATVVASCDNDFIQYPASLRLQEFREEVGQYPKFRRRL